MSLLIDIASAELGVREVKGGDHNRRILDYAHEAGFEWVNDDETPWCSIFLNWVCQVGGYERSKDARARSWATVGVPVSDPVPGDIVLTGWSADITHVAILTGFSQDGKQVFCLGGNQGDEVNIAPFPVGTVKGFRRIARLTEEIPFYYKKAVEKPAENTDLPPNGPMATNAPTDGPVAYALRLPVNKVRWGDRGKDVLDLQIALNAVGFHCGVPNGIFDTQTLRALNDLKKKAGLKPTEKFGKRTREYLDSLLKGMQYTPREAAPDPILSTITYTPVTVGQS